jgi:hypothetical protein
MTPGRFATFAAALATAAAVVGVALLTGHPSPAPQAAPDTLAVVQPESDSGTWAAAAAALPITASSADVPPYERESFGEPGTDIEGNGCTQRDDVLARDLEEVVLSGCAVVSGILHDPYSGGTLEYPADATRTDEAERGIRIDHIVGLRAAHQGGAWNWTPERRLEFANSLENMLAVDGSAIETKRGQGPGKWLPTDADFVCEYAIRYTWIATAWQLAVPSADRDALVTTLTDCRR